MAGPERGSGAGSAGQRPRGGGAPSFERGTPGPARDGRDAACRVVARQARAFPLLVPTEPEVSGLDGREAALAHAIHDAVLRRWLTLSYLIERVSGRGLGDLEPAMRAVLLCGAAQLLLMDRIPPHAAIDQGVEWAKRRIRPKAAGMANAILRRVEGLIVRGEGGGVERRARWSDRRDEIPMGDGSARVLAGEVLPEDPRERLSIIASVPAPLLARWEGADARGRALHALTSPPTILNAMHAEAPLPAGLHPHERAGHLVWTAAAGSHADLAALLRGRDDVWVQDPGSSASALLGHEALVRRAMPGRASPRLIADVCAGQGTKTRQLAHLFPDAEILATDTDASRLATLRGVFAGHRRVRVLDREGLASEGLGRCDLVLLDVPCSNTGVLSRRPEARYRLTARTLERMGEVQRQIAADSIPLLAPRGMILYATCSLEPEENEQIAAWLARWHDLRTLAQQRCEPAGQPGDPPERHADGSYAVLVGR